MYKVETLFTDLYQLATIAYKTIRMPASDTLTPPHTTSFLSPYLPPSHPSSSTYPFVTLTYATSLDSHLSLSPGTQTHLSGPPSKSLTHYLRTQHAAILIGVSTAVADDPGLNSRLPGTCLSDQPRPIIIDPDFRWEATPSSRVLQAAAEGKGKAPYVIVTDDAHLEAHKSKLALILNAGGFVFSMPPPPLNKDGKKGRWEWDDILRFIKSECKLDSLMVEGGGEVINSLLSPVNQKLVNSVIVTIAPVYLGQGGVNVSPAAQTGKSGQRIPVAKFKDVQWKILGNDVVMAARPDV